MKKKLKLTAWLRASAGTAGIPAELRELAREAISRFEFSGKEGQEALVVDGKRALLLIGTDCEIKGGARDDSQVVYCAARSAAAEAVRLRCDLLHLGGIPRLLAENAFRGVEFERYSYKVYGRRKPRSLIVTVASSSSEQRVRAGVIARASALARDYVNTPPSGKTPALFASAITREIRRRGRSVQVEVWDHRKLVKKNCRGILAVGQGSVNPPRIVKISWSPRGARRHVVLVGKGVVFDSGGLNIKPYEGMKAMKCDMAGAAAVLGATAAAIDLKIPVKVTSFVGLVENMPSGSAYKPGDVIKMRSGKTIEVLNTDAEGRIVLGDLLDLARELKPFSVVNLATLTGACMVALGEERAGLFSNDDHLASRLSQSGARTAEPLWRMPLGAEFRAAIKGNISDIKNVGNRYGGASSAAEFLHAFVGECKWAHLDIAGPAFKENGKPHGASGFGVALLVDYLRNL